jgi:hypothetical protein
MHDKFNPELHFAMDSIRNHDSSQQVQNGLRDGWNPLLRSGNRNYVLYVTVPRFLFAIDPGTVSVLWPLYARIRWSCLIYPVVFSA